MGASNCERRKCAQIGISVNRHPIMASNSGWRTSPKQQLAVPVDVQPPCGFTHLRGGAYA